MKNLKKLVSLAIIATMLLGCLTGLTITTSAANAPDIIRDGLFAWYDGINNSNGTHDTSAAVWKDLSGNGRHMRVRVDEKNFWMDNAYHSDGALNYFHEDLVNLINSETFTVEMVMGEYAPSPEMGDRMVLFYSDNTELCLCFRNDKPEGEKYFEFKYNDANGDRPKAFGDVNQVQSATAAITFDFGAKICYVYINGVEVASGVPEHMLNTNLFYFNSSDNTRCFAGDVHGFRFYDRVLSPDELAENAASDQLKYRSGNKYDLVKEYDDSEEQGEEQGEQITYVNNILPINNKTNVIDLPGTGAYGSESLSEYMYPFESDEVQWEGAKLTYVEDETGNTPNLHINYRGFCGRNGLDQIPSAEAGYVALKIKVEGTIEDINLYAMAGTTYSVHDAGGFSTGSIYGGAECTGDVEYLIYDIYDVLEGNMNYLKLTIEGMAADAAVYLYEVAFFATEQAAYEYAGYEWSDETDPPAVETDAPAVETDAPAVETDAPVGGDDKTDETKVAGDDKPEDGTSAPVGGDDKTDETDVVDDEDEGCASVVGFGAAAILVAAAAAVVLKKKD